MTDKRKVEKILVANRGEIAVRIMKTAHKMGIATVAVYSDADRMAPHVLLADQAFHIGASPSSESYLDMDKIIAVAKSCKADAIHPGYGFLSENASFARKVRDAEIVFIGPSAESIEIMGSKLAAKDAVKDYNIPLVPGTDEAISDIKESQKIAEDIGFPVLIKASAGGGGKGMRIVENREEFESQMERAVSEAISAFGDGSVFIEKYIASPRHIEIQILADNHGNIIHLFERECSIQRRHQKVIEEAPSSVLDEELRNKMGQAAIDVARACHYSGVGTVEFLVDPDLNYYFLEMNTRLQVEHPVTELVTGVDLVEQQIRVARNEILALGQKDLNITGHAIELRVYAEDPVHDFLPSVGLLEEYQIPEGKGVRVDDGYKKGMEIPIYYDPMIAKLICYGSSREEAISIMLDAIREYRIEGVETTLPFGKYVLEHPSFREGRYDTHFVKNHFTPEDLKNKAKEEFKVAAQIAMKLYIEKKGQLKVAENNSVNWKKARLLN